MSYQETCTIIKIIEGIMRYFVLLFTLTLLVFGCDTKMESENAQLIKLEFKEGSGQVVGKLRATTPGMAGISSREFDFSAPGSFEVMGGPSEYEIVFSSIPRGLEKGWTLTVDGTELKRAKDIVVEDDKGPRLSFKIGLKKPAAAKE